MSILIRSNNICTISFNSKENDLKRKFNNSYYQYHFYTWPSFTVCTVLDCVRKTNHIFSTRKFFIG